MTFSLAEIDRTIFEYLRLGLVQAGYLPDMTQYTNQTDWDSARAALSQSLPDGMIEIFGVGTADDRDEWNGNKIVVNRTNEDNGILGGGGIEYTRNTDGTFTSQFIPQQSTNITYEVQFNAMSAAYERVISEMVTRALGIKRYINSVDNTGVLSNNKFFYLKRIQKIDSSSLHFLQKTVIFNVEDIFLTAETNILDTDIVPMNSITFRLLAVTHSDATIDTPIDVIIGA